MPTIVPLFSRLTRIKPIRPPVESDKSAQPPVDTWTQDEDARTAAGHGPASGEIAPRASSTTRGKSVKIAKQQGHQADKPPLPRIVYSESDFKSLQSSHCRFGRPLIILADKQPKGLLFRYSLSDEFLENRDPNVNAFRALEHKEAFLFNATSSKQLRPLEVQWILHEDAGSLYEVVFDLNLQSEGPDQFTRQFGMAALLASGLLGFVDQELANTVRSQVPENSQESGLNNALLLCHGEKGASAAKFLLDWGASPNACTPDDDMSALVCALSRKDQPMIKLLVESGADTTSDLGAHESAAQLVTEEGFTHLAPLLHPTTSSSSPI